MPSKATKDFMAVPALSVRDGRPVIIKKRDIYDPIEDEDGRSITPKEFVEELAKRYGDVLYMMDIDGITDNAPQYSIIKDLSDVVELWVDAGSTSTEGLMDVLVAGAHKAVLSTKCMRYLEDIEEALEVSDKVLLCIDLRKDVVAKSKDISRMSPWSIADYGRKAGMKEMVLADYRRKRKGELNLDVVGDIVRTGVDLFVGGKVEDEDLGRLREAGAKGALLDMRAIIKGW